MIIIFTESLFALNKFKRPKVLEDKQAMYTLLIRLLLLEPGTIQSHPDMGVGIVSRYRYSFEGSARELQQDINRQISKFLPEFQGSYVDVTDSDGTFKIEITIDDTLYDFSFNTTEGKFESLVNL